MIDLKEITRRKMLATLAGASVLVLTGACSSEEAEKKTSGSGDTGGATNGGSGGSSAAGSTGEAPPAPEQQAQTTATSGEGAFSEMILGDPAAPVTIIAYESLSCPHCASFHANTMPQLKEKYIDTGKVKFIMRDFPFDRITLTAHKAARCAGPDRFYPLVELLFSTQGQWMRAEDKIAEIKKISRMAGLSDEAFEACAANKKLDDFIINRIEEANKKWQVASTPTFIVNDQKAIVGAQPFEEFERVLKPLVN